jgi:uncharacterized protein YjbI with pentapeptide repeats
MPFDLPAGYTDLPPGHASPDGSTVEQTEAVESEKLWRAAYANAREELQVRLTAQRILAAHLRLDGESRRQMPDECSMDDYSHYWEEICIDLTGATLVDFDFHACTIFSINCSSADFIGGANFAQARFIDDVSFSSARFAPNDKGIGDPAANFSHAVFQGDANFIDATFTDKAEFSESIFEGKASFCSHFSYAAFDRSTFKADAWFVAANFTDSVSFREAHFAGLADFTEVMFTQERLGLPAYFGKATFTHAPNLFGAAVIKKSEPQVRLTTSSSNWPPGWKTVLAKNNVEYLAREATLPSAAE